jgi:hypothetical protein
MRLVLHIFIKDTRRFWWEIAVILGLLAGVARMDATRVGFIPGVMEGWRGCGDCGRPWIRALAYLPQLLLKQLVLAAALTVPAAALAAVTRNQPQFILQAWRSLQWACSPWLG